MSPKELSLRSKLVSLKSWRNWSNNCIYLIWESVKWNQEQKSGRGVTRKIDRSKSCGCIVHDPRKGTIGTNGECARGPLQPTFPLTYHPSQFCRFLHPHVISHFSASLNSSNLTTSANCTFLYLLFPFLKCMHMKFVLIKLCCNLQIRCATTSVSGLACTSQTIIEIIMAK